MQTNYTIKYVGLVLEMQTYDTIKYEGMQTNYTYKRVWRVGLKSADKFYSQGGWV